MNTVIIAVVILIIYYVCNNGKFIERFNKNSCNDEQNERTLYGDAAHCKQTGDTDDDPVRKVAVPKKGDEYSAILGYEDNKTIGCTTIYKDTSEGAPDCAKIVPCGVTGGGGFFGAFTTCSQMPEIPGYEVRCIKTSQVPWWKFWAHGKSAFRPGGQCGYVVVPEDF